MFFNTYKNLVDWSMKALDLGCGERSLLFKTRLGRLSFRGHWRVSGSPASLSKVKSFAELCFCPKTVVF
jgi:hypothetical protein